MSGIIRSKYNSRFREMKCLISSTHHHAEGESWIIIKKNPNVKLKGYITSGVTEDIRGLAKSGLGPQVGGLQELHLGVSQALGALERWGRYWIRQLNDGRTSVHHDPWSGQTFVVNGGLVENVIEKICESRRFTIRRFCDEFPQRAVQQWLSSLAASFCKVGKDALVSRYDKYLNSGSNYAEK
ncbi:HTH_48 domain-containing protein [Trichonephila clavipes]|uniref:HTH_48 domain-containing protein n=1 Tax=Trichonephila clavipes TaxID=2585209 RepID=A0A8X6SV56_TRICX|nr:HTH_48 domain-containing protein [Trichonephila clavipes]